MKLYFKPGACSLSPHIVLRELALPFELVQVDTKAGKTKAGEDFRAINPRGAVPTLRLDDGQVLTEGAVIVQYLADRKPDAQLAPANGTLERYRLQEVLNFIASDVHKGFSPLFRPIPDEAKKTLREVLGKHLDHAARMLEGKQYLIGDRFTVADAYLFTVLRWSGAVGLELSNWKALQQFHDRVAARPAVKAALAAEDEARKAA